MITNDFIVAVRNEANAIIEERKADGLEPLATTAHEVSERLHANYTDTVFAFGALHAYGVATCGSTLNDYYYEKKKH